MKLEFECRRVISFIFISCDGMNNAELGLADDRMLDMHEL